MAGFAHLPKVISLDKGLVFSLRNIKNYFSFSATHLLTDIAHLLLSGGVIAVPTDTIYGIACCSLSTRGIKRVYQIKGRDAAKPLAICLDKVLPSRIISHHF